ncbi:uncharacterized protein LOC113240234 [Hyposmocoma kahamanoa]|uniref:uncharacterized protein LOC113240234 n=1 Tax=Hyposmocoma kahamanoa TaxID=1477025 RepID=UPI000E6D9FE0|nr:uncharacterized protein LOC113240234 [Hyposmocoma kahamanoa]
MDSSLGKVKTRTVDVLLLLVLFTFSVNAYTTYTVEGTDYSFPTPHLHSLDVRVRRDTAAPGAAVAAAAPASPTGSVPITMATPGKPPHSSNEPNRTEPNRTINTSKYNSSNNLVCSTIKHYEFWIPKMP